MPFHIARQKLHVYTEKPIPIGASKYPFIFNTIFNPLINFQIHLHLVQAALLLSLKGMSLLLRKIISRKPRMTRGFYGTKKLMLILMASVLFLYKYVLRDYLSLLPEFNRLDEFPVFSKIMFHTPVRIPQLLLVTFLPIKA